jgi:pyridoxal phosphate enzyme (YggS family)
MHMTEQIMNKLHIIQSKIHDACQRSNRNPAEVQLIAVTKYVTTEVTRIALEVGLHHIGENRWQDAKPKWEAIHPQGTWHFIGHLQSNKVKDIVGKFAYIHSVDRLSLAQEIDKVARSLGIQVHIFIQLNVSGEQTKYGLDPQEFIPFVKEIRSFEHLYIAGLMTMAPYESDPQLTRPIFRELRQWRDMLNEQAILPYAVQHLSMGMSNDYEVAIEEGATWIRVGSAILSNDYE